jgi:hypothetical protein
VGALVGVQPVSGNGRSEPRQRIEGTQASEE